MQKPNRRLAKRLNHFAELLEQRGEEGWAEQKYKRAIRHCPQWPAPWYNLGLLYKYQHRWQESLTCNSRALELDPEFASAAWNLGIAATALSQWATARRAWRAYGVTIDETHGAEEEELRLFASHTPIRIYGDSIEVVWCARIDPARAFINSIPTPASGFVCGDLVLHDGAPNGYRMSGGRELAVFDAMTLLRPSDLKTFEARLCIPGEADFAALEKACVEASLPMEDWGTMRHLCKACSEGRPHDAHDHSPQRDSDSEAQDAERSIVFAARDEQAVRALIQSWTTAERYLVELEMVFAHPVKNEDIDAGSELQKISEA